MEPRSIDRGKRLMYCRCARSPCQLQWSRDQLIAESDSNATKFVEQWRASMEPRSIDRGKMAEIEKRAQAELTSMEPRSCDRGKDAIAHGIHSANPASMEPRSCDRGKIQGYWGGEEAPMTLQWSRDHVIAERIRYGQGFFLPCSFNGAAIM